MEKGGMSTLVQKNLKFSNINIQEYCLDNDIEACALKLKSKFSNICNLALYRAPSQNFSEFLNRLSPSLIYCIYKKKKNRKRKGRRSYFW
jgi:hypothetical protein